MSQQPDRGDNGALPDPHWHTRWRAWPREKVDDYLAQAATWGPLKPEQCVALLQGLPPPPAGWLSQPIVLEEHAAIVNRFGQDVERGALPACPTPNELAAWADAMNVDLPEPFVESLRLSSRLAPTAQRAPQAVAPVKIPPWVPPGATGNLSPEAKPKVGRPRTSEAQRRALIDEGIRTLMSAAGTGELLKLHEIAKKLSGLESFAGFEEANIERRLSGQLPFRQARAVAGQHKRQRSEPKGAARPRR